jgi:hypothetical protein
MSFAKLKIKNSRNASLAVAVALLAAGCTQSVPSQFKLLRAEDSAPAAFEVGEVVVEKHGAPIDILWVVDNSASMLTSQTKLKNGLAAFARDYLTKDGTDIQLAVITTDTYVANNAWEKYLNTENPETKKTPLQVHASKEPNQRQWGPDYAKISASALMSTKSKSGLVSNFQSRVLVGTQGMYEEHGFDSVAQFIADNEKGSSANKLFRKGSQRIIIFLSAMTLCARPGTVEGVNVFKDQLDSFFRGLDGNPVGSPNYFVTAIVGQDPKTIETLRRNTTEKNAETKLTVITNEIGSRYLDLVNEAGNGSFAMDIGASDYSPILKKIGLEIEKRSVVKKTSPQTTFILDRAPDTREKLVVTVQTAGGRVFVLADSQYHVAANKLVITDKSLISVLQPGDRISVQYQPATVLPASK